MRAVFAVGVLLLGVGCDDSTSSSAPASMIDDKPMTPNSMHCGHVNQEGR